MTEYWTDTIIEKLAPGITRVVRGEPVRIYKADEVADLAGRWKEIKKQVWDLLAKQTETNNYDEWVMLGEDIWKTIDGFTELEAIK